MKDRASKCIEYICAFSKIAMRAKLDWRECYTTLKKLFRKAKKIQNSLRCFPKFLFLQSLGRFFVDHMTNASLGAISNAHVVHADMSPLGANDPKCLQLSEQAALAVDFPKTGVPGIMPRDLAPKEYPDFMEKRGRPSYKSKKVIGTMYRAVREKIDGNSTYRQEGPEIEVLDENEDEERQWFPSESSVTSAYDHDMVVPGYEAYLEEAWRLKCQWDRGNLNLMRHVSYTDV